MPGSSSPSRFGAGVGSSGVTRSRLWSSELPAIVGGAGLVNPLAGVAFGALVVVVGVGVGAGVVARGGGDGAASRFSDCSGGSSWSGSWDSAFSSVVGSLLPSPAGLSIGSTNDGVGVLPTPLVCQGVAVA